MTLTKKFAAVLGIGSILGLGGCTETLNTLDRGIGTLERGLGLANQGHYAYQCAQTGRVINSRGQCVPAGQYYQQPAPGYYRY